VRRRSAALDPAVDGDARAKRRLLDRLEEGHRGSHLLVHRRVEGELERRHDEIRRNEHRVLRPGDAYRRIQDRRLELDRREGEQHPPLTALAASAPGAAADGSLSAPSAMTRTSLPGSLAR
jgi:hypothetical protein